MAHKLDNTGRTEATEYSKKLLNRREYIKTGAAFAAIVTGSGAALTDLTSAGGTVEAFSTGFGEYTQ